MQPYIIRFAIIVCSLVVGEPGDASGNEPVYTGFVQPPSDCKPHTRWWWMGNALRKEDITWQLDQMQAQGIGGVEQISMGAVYTKGNHEYLSPAYFKLLRHAVEEARRRGMSFSLNFGGPGWIWGGDWLPKEDQSKVLLASMLPLEGPQRFSGPLPEKAAFNPRDIPRSMPQISMEDRLLKVVAARGVGDRLLSETLVDLSSLAHDRSITWDVPEGRWQLMAFWLTQRDNADAVDHLNPDAMSRYCERLGAQYADAIGRHFGETVESFFGDSFEVPIYRNGLYWTDGLFEIFEKEKGYDLVPWLPALWWEVDALSPKVRYDVNEFLHLQGMTAFFHTFLDWCTRHNVLGRIQSYGFVTDIIEGAGITHIPEMEITPGEKDAVPWFDTRIGPREYVASGAHLYGGQRVSVEAFTYLHWAPYRATLEELKIATDGFLRAGANLFYNHGFIASPERDIVPTRGFFAAIRISPENVWWPYYHLLATYTARCCWLLRQGDFIAYVAVYSPLANQWTETVLNARKWTREFEWGGLGKLLNANGYGFDLVNDDVLQHHAGFDGPRLHLGKMTYRVLVLPDIKSLPLETYQRIESYVRQGGALIALERIPEASTGMQDHAQQDEAVRRLSAELFQAPTRSHGIVRTDYGDGQTFQLDTVLRRADPLDEHSAPFDPFLKALRDCVHPDLDVDLVLAGKRTNEGLVFIHRRTETMDIYFVTNIQDTMFKGTVGFRVIQGQPYCWNPHTGERRALLDYTRDETHTRLNISMAPFESRIIVFEKTDHTEELPRILQSDFADILQTSNNEFSALATHNGPHAFLFFDGAGVQNGMAMVNDLPAVYEIGGPWAVQFQKDGRYAEQSHWPVLQSWTNVPELRHFSGRARYVTSFELAQEYLNQGIHLRLSLGVVGNVAEIQINDRPAGVHWMGGQEFNIDGMVHPGRNTLEIEVTNTLINRVSGLNEFPEVPKDLQPVFGTGLHKSTPEAQALIGFEPLPRSGLLGPVHIIPSKEVHITL